MPEDGFSKYVIFVPPSDWADSTTSLFEAHGRPQEDDIERFRGASTSHRTLVVTEESDFQSKYKVVAGVAFETSDEQEQTPAGRLTGEYIRTTRLFGGFTLPDQTGIGLTEPLFAAAGVIAALQLMPSAPVFSTVDVDDLQSRLRLNRANFDLHSWDSAAIGQRRSAARFAQWVVRRQSSQRPQVAQRIAVLGRRGLIKAAETLADLYESYLLLPTGDCIRFVDVAEGRNTVVMAAVAVGRNYDGWREGYGLMGERKVG